MPSVTDASIPLSFLPTKGLAPDFSPLWEVAHERQQQQEIQQRNALAQQQMAQTAALQAPVNALRTMELQRQLATQKVFSDPANVDKDGNLTPTGKRQLFQADPEAGMKYQQNELVTQQKQLQEQVTKSDLFKQKVDLTTDVNGSALERYNEDIKNGVPEPQARANAQKTFTEGMERAKQSGLFSEQEQRQLAPQFDPQRAKDYVTQSKEWSERKKREALSPAQLAEADADTIANAEIARRKAAGEVVTPEVEAQIRQDARNKPKVDLQTQKSEANAINDDAARRIAEQALAGDWSGVTGMGRNQASMKKIADMITTVAKEQGMTGADIAAKKAEFAGLMGAERILGVRQTGIQVGIAEAKQFAPQVLELSNKIDRTRFPTVNALQLAAERGTGGEDVVRMVDALNAYKMAYTQILTRGGMPTDDSRKRSDEVIDKAWSQGQIRAAIDQLGKEMVGAESAVPEVRAGLWSNITGKPKSEYPGLKNAAPAGGTTAKRDEGLPRPKSEAEYKALPPGARYVYTDGSIRTKGQ